jgi:hypothetical protein
MKICQQPNYQRIEMTWARVRGRSINDHKPVLPSCRKELRCSVRCIEFIEQWENPQSGWF